MERNQSIISSFAVRQRPLGFSLSIGAIVVGRQAPRPFDLLAVTIAMRRSTETDREASSLAKSIGPVFVVAAAVALCIAIKLTGQQLITMCVRASRVFVSMGSTAGCGYNNDHGSGGKSQQKLPCPEVGGDLTMAGCLCIVFNFATLHIVFVRNAPLCSALCVSWRLVPQLYGQQHSSETRVT